MENGRNGDFRRKINTYKRNSLRSAGKKTTGKRERLLMQAYVSAIMVLAAFAISHINTSFTNQVQANLERALKETVSLEDVKTIGTAGIESVGAFGKNAGEMIGDFLADEEKTNQDSVKVFQEQDDSVPGQQEDSEIKNQLPPEGILPEN